jgi:diguanylate cyclase (GGDEF)-like protein/PAS domain S-box-containing protein
VTNGLVADDEALRLDSLRALDLLDTDPEPEFDELVRIAAAICEVPISTMTLVDERRQWFKAAVGVAHRENPREISFCSRAIERPDFFVVEDASKDERFSSNPLVTAEGGIRFYAGMPLEGPGGYRLGTLCVIDTVPRRLSYLQRDTLMVLAHQVMARMELRLQRRALEKILREKEELARELKASEQIFRAFMDNSPFVSFMKSSDGRYIYYNKRTAEVFGIESGEWLGTTDREHFPDELATIYMENDAAVLRSGEGTVVIETSAGPDGSARWWRSHKFPCHDLNGTPVLGGISVDVTAEWQREIQLEASKLELEEANQQLKELSLTDALTGMRNRRALEQRLEVEFSMARRKRRALTMVLLDIDHFKQVNDREGHAAGDEVLCEVAGHLQACVRMTDMAARYGGEEFGVILTETDAGNALAWAERLKDAMARAVWKYGAVTLSMGIAPLCDDVAGVADLVERADRALYAAKRNGRNRAVVYREAVEFGDYAHDAPPNRSAG